MKGADRTVPRERDVIFECKRCQRIASASQSPDLNPMENVWIRIQPKYPNTAF